MKSRRQLLDMRAQILEDQAALPAILNNPKDKELLDAINRHLAAERGIIDTALEWKDRKKAVAATHTR